MRKYNKGFLFLVALLLFVSLTGCSNDTKRPEVSDTQIPQESPVVERPGPAETEEPVETEEPYIETRPPIIYLTNSKKPDEVATAVNKRLLELGTEYSVRFVGLGSDDYVKDLMAYIDSEKECDILFTGMARISSYDTLVNNGYLQSFNDYLETENGQLLKASLPNDKWYALERKGQIYGVDGYPWEINSPPSYRINVDLMKKYDLAEKDFRKPLADLVDILDLVKKGEGEDFYPLSYTLDYKTNSGVRINDAVIVDRDTKKAGLLIDNEEYIETLRVLHSMYMDGYLKVGTNYNLDEYLITFSLSTPFPYALPNMGWLKKQGSTATHEDVVTIPLDGYVWYGQKITSCTGVSAKSQKKDYAFDFLTKVYTDTKLSNLLLFGIEGIDYKIVDGIVSEGRFDMNRWLVYGNSFIASPLEYEFKNKTELYMDLHNQAELDPLCRFVFDDSEVNDIISKTNECMKNVDRIFRVRLFEEGADFDDVIDGIRQELYEAGVQTLIDDANAQVSEFLKREE